LVENKNFFLRLDRKDKQFKKFSKEVFLELDKRFETMAIFETNEFKKFNDNLDKLEKTDEKILLAIEQKLEDGPKMELQSKLNMAKFQLNIYQKQITKYEDEITKYEDEITEYKETSEQMLELLKNLQEEVKSLQQNTIFNNILNVASRLSNLDIKPFLKKPI
jgi:flagellar biosynthesis chaperone FliJ